MSQDIVSELAPSGTIRAGINMANSLLVTGSTAAGDPTGVSPDMAYEIAGRLGVAASYVPFASPSEVADAACSDAWDIAFKYMIEHSAAYARQSGPLLAQHRFAVGRSCLGPPRMDSTA